MAEFIDVKRLADEVRRRLSPARFAHVQGVVQAAAQLARRWGVAEHKAVWPRGCTTWPRSCRRRRC